MTRKLGLKIGTDGGAITKIFGDATLNLNDSGDANLTMRNVIVTAGGSGTQVRVTLEAAAAAALDLDNVSVGVSNGTASETTAVPVELLFGGASGYVFAANEQKTSDWATLTVSSGATLVVTGDFGATDGNPAWTNAGQTGNTIYYKSGNSYNEAAPAGMTVLFSNAVMFVVSIEVQ